MPPISYYIGENEVRTTFGQTYYRVTSSFEFLPTSDMKEARREGVRETANQFLT